MSKKFAVSQSVVMFANNRFACIDRDDDSLIHIDGVSLDAEAATKLRNWLTSVLPDAPLAKGAKAAP